MDHRKKFLQKCNSPIFNFTTRDPKSFHASVGLKREENFRICRIDRESRAQLVKPRTRKSGLIVPIRRNL